MIPAGTTKREALSCLKPEPTRCLQKGCGTLWGGGVRRPGDVEHGILPRAAFLVTGTWSTCEGRGSAQKGERQLKVRVLEDDLLALWRLLDPVLVFA